MNAVLDRILGTKIVQTLLGQEMPLHSGIDRFEGNLLSRWISTFQPKNILEIGMAYGVSSLFICDAIKHRSDVAYTILDPNQNSDWQGCGVYHLTQAGFQERYTLYEEPSEICLPRFLSEGRRFDFVFIDGFHTFDHALVDFFYINRMLTTGGVVLFDDTQLPSIQKVFAHIATYPCYRPLALPDDFQNHRIARARRMMNSPLTRINGFLKISVDDRPWDWYRDF